MTDNSIFGDARYLSLSKEREIQGAYRNQCMDAPERRFQIRRNNKDDEGLVEIVVRQGNIGSVSDRKSSDEQATGVRVWNSAVSLLRILTLDPFLVENKAVVELGAGSGVVSIAAYHLGASQVIATDSNSEVLRLLQHNIKANLKLFNDAQENIQGVPLSWGVMGAAEFRDKYLASKAADVILGSDLTYNAGVFRQLLDTWTELADSDTQIIYVSARHDGFAAEVDAFRVLAEASGFGWEERTAWYRKQIPNFDETAKVIFLRLPKDKM